MIEVEDERQVVAERARTLYTLQLEHRATVMDYLYFEFLNILENSVRVTFVFHFRAQRFMSCPILTVISFLSPFSVLLHEFIIMIATLSSLLLDLHILFQFSLTSKRI